MRPASRRRLSRLEAVHFVGAGPARLRACHNRRVGFGDPVDVRARSRWTERAQPTRLETRTKESDTDASTRVASPRAQ